MADERMRMAGKRGERVRLSGEFEERTHVSLFSNGGTPPGHLAHQF